MKPTYTPPRRRAHMLYSRVRHPVVCAVISANAITTAQRAQNIVGGRVVPPRSAA